MNSIFKKENVALLFTYSKRLFDIERIFNLKFDSNNQIIEWSAFNLSWKISDNEISNVEIKKYTVQYNDLITVICPKNIFIIKKINDSDFKVYTNGCKHSIGLISYNNDKIFVYHHKHLIIECVLKNEKLYKLIFEYYGLNHQIINHGDIQMLVKNGNDFEVFNFDEYKCCIEYKTISKKFKFNYINKYVNNIELCVGRCKINIDLDSESNILNKTEMKF